MGERAGQFLLDAFRDACYKNQLILTFYYIEKYAPSKNHTFMCDAEDMQRISALTPFGQQLYPIYEKLQNGELVQPLLLTEHAIMPLHDEF